MNKNGGHDLVQCSLICRFLPSKIADELLCFCLLISDLFVLFVCFFFLLFPFRHETWADRCGCGVSNLGCRSYCICLSTQGAA